MNHFPGMQPLASRWLRLRRWLSCLSGREAERIELSEAAAARLAKHFTRAADWRDALTRGDDVIVRGGSIGGFYTNEWWRKGKISGRVGDEVTVVSALNENRVLLKCDIRSPFLRYGKNAVCFMRKATQGRLSQPSPMLPPFVQQAGHQADEPGRLLHIVVRPQQGQLRFMRVTLV